MWECSRHHQNRDEAKFCGKCGEKHVLEVRCSACGATLDPEDVFCTSCGQPREESVPATPPAPEPVPAILAPEPPAVPSASVASQPELSEEPVTFSFGGALIEMKDDTTKPPKSATANAGSGLKSSSKLSPAASAILSFVLFAAVLAAALYFVSR